jgi:hypothetical protein
MTELQVTFEQLQTAIDKASEACKRHESNEESLRVANYHYEALVDVMLAKIGFKPVDAEPEPKKKRKNNWSPERREAAAKRMRDMVNKKNAE